MKTEQALEIVRWFNTNYPTDKDLVKVYQAHLIETAHKEVGRDVPELILKCTNPSDLISRKRDRRINHVIRTIRL